MSTLMELTEKVNCYVGMFLPGKTYGEFVALVYGFDIARDQKPLEGFKEWLVLKFGKGNNLTWGALALLGLRIVLPSFVAGPAQLHIEAIAGLTSLISEFTKDREEKGIDEILDNHKNWLHRQDWYKG